MSRVDVTDLAREDLPAGDFPAAARAPFRLHMAPEVRRGIEAHAKADPTVEICGVLVGRWRRDENGPFAEVTDFIRCDSATSKYAEVTFTHESWAQINHEMDTRYADKRIVGWYHSHPDFGIFLSERDAFIHEHFFSGAGQVAYVIDPVRDLEGVFTWQRGKPAPISHFWVGDEIRTVDASQRNPSRDGGTPTTSAGATGAAVNPATLPSAERSSLAFPLTLLGFLSLFLLGYLYGGWRTTWERKMIIEGAVAHYGVNKLMKVGMEQDLTAVRKTLQTLKDELSKLPAPDEKLSEKQAEQAAKQRQQITDRLALVEQKLEQIQTQYGFTSEELRVLAQLLAIRQAELNRAPPSPTKSADSKVTKQAAPSAEKRAAQSQLTDFPNPSPPAAKDSTAAPQPAPTDPKTTN